MAHVAIIGAGPAGSICAANLLNNGVEVTILEKAVFPRVVVGESLLPVSMEHFERVGFLDAMKAAEFELKPGARFFKGDNEVDFDFSEQFTKGWTWTWQVPRAEFDQIMTDKVQEKGGKIEFGATINAISAGDAPEVRYSVNGMDHTLHPDLIIDASGLACVVPRMLGLEVKTDQYPNWAVFTHVQDIGPKGPVLPQRICFDVLEQDFWFWSIPFSNGTASIGFAGHRRHFEELQEGEEALRALITKSERFRGRYEQAPMLFEPKWYRGYSSASPRLHGKGWVLCGNCAEFLDPIFSSGVALASATGFLAAELALKQFQGHTVDWASEYEGHIRQGINVFRDYVDSWYSGELQDIFFSGQLNPSFKEQICSVLAGYIWDQENPFVRKGKAGLTALHKVLGIMQRSD